MGGAQLHSRGSGANPEGRADSPRQKGYRMPAEWEPHEATWLAWPHDSNFWSDQWESVKAISAEITRALSPFETVRLLVNDDRTEEEARERLQAIGADMGHVFFARIDTVDVWIRDYGPTFVTTRQGEQRIAASKWVFNAWGGKYDAYLREDRVAREIAGLLGLPVFEPGLVLEGGSIEVNGCGSCLTTEQCLLNPNRNPLLGRDEIERILGEHLGIDHFIWLSSGLEGDDTDGHIDNLARFVNPTTVVCAYETDAADANYASLQENYRRLKGATDQEGRRLRVVPLPQPGRIEYEGVRLPASYANFYIANGVVLVPLYDDPNDRAAVEILKSLFPERQVVGIRCAPLLVGMGAIHCITQQQPAP